jgi:hypothetical protein
LLLANGHSDAWSYSLGQIAVEAELVTRMIDLQFAHQVSLLHTMISAIPSMSVKPEATKRSAKEFFDRVKALIHGG